MRNDQGNQEKHRFWKYSNIALIVIIILLGINRFGFTRSTGVVRAGGDSLGDMALAYYLEKYPDQAGDEGVEAIVKNFGCHKEIYIYKNGNRVMRMSYSNGKIYELD